MKNKLLKFFRNSAVFLMIAGVLFSIIPFYALTGLIDSYEKTSGIVDKIWLVQQNHGSDVVDNFSSIKNFAKKLEIPKAMAAINIRNVGAYLPVTANVTPVIPATAAAGDMMLLIYGTKPYNDAPTITAGWNLIGSATDGTVAAGIDVGSMQTRIYYKEHTGSETNPTVTNGTNNVSGAVIIVFQKGAGEVWETPVGAGGGDATAGTGFSVTASANPGITVGDMLVGYAAIRSDAGAQSTIGITAAGLTVGAFTESPAADLITTAGGDMAMSGGYRLVTAGTASAAPVYASTLAAAHTGSAFIVRLRATTPSNTTTITNFVSAEPGNSTIAPAASGLVDSFGFAASAGTDTVTAVTVALAAGMGQYIQTVAITNDGDTVTYCSAAPSGDTASLTSCTVPVTTTNTQFKIKLTAKSHALMPAPAGGTYAVTATVTGWTGTNATHAGTDSGSSTLTIDNASPAGTTGAGATSAENAQSTVSWTNPGDGDFQQVYVYCKTSSMISGEAPAEGTDPAVDATACDGTARMKYKGTASPQTITSLTNGTTYYFRIYARDTNGNFTAYSATQEVTGTPSAPVPTLTISASVGSKVANVDSGATSVFVHNTGCTTDGTCAAFKLAASGGAANVTSITVTETNASLNADTDLANATLIYDTDANYSNGTAGTFGTDATFASQAVTFTNLGLNIPSGNTFYFYIRTDLANGTARPDGGLTMNFSIANATDVVSDGTESGTATLAGTTTIRPNITSITYPITSPLNGARLGQSGTTITGAGFGTTCDGTNNKVMIGTAVVNCAQMTFSDTSITINNNWTYSSGDSYGGATTLLATIGGTADDLSKDFYVYPDITDITNPTAYTNAAREYSASDSDGVITINGNHFGTAQGTGSVTVLGTTVSGGDIVSWGATAIQIRIPTAISDSSYTGNIVVNQGTGGNSTASDTFGGGTYRMLPRITDLAPANGIIGATVTANGNHLCQAGAASCPIGFDANNKITFFNAVDATNFVSWSNTSATTTVPTSAQSGNVVLKSNNYDSNALNFTVDPYTTTLATGSDPAVNTIAPGASATDVDLFTLQTNGGTESVTSVTVNLSTNSGVGTLAITDNAGTPLGSVVPPSINTGSNTISVSGMSAVSGSATTFKVRVTPLSHANMLAPNGGAYSITAPVTAWAGGGGNTHSGSDTNPNALTIDNASPSDATATSISAGDTSVTIGWTTSGSTDFSTSVVLRWAASSAGSETPTEGQSYSIGNTITTATVACVVSSAPSTAQSKVDGTGGSAECTTTALTNGQDYTYKVFEKDTNGNYNTGTLIGTVAPIAVTASELHEYVWSWDINDGAYAGRPLGRNGNEAGGTQDNTDGEKYQAFIIGSNANEATNDRAIRLRWVNKASGEVNPTITFVYWCTGTDGAGTNCPAGVPTAKASAWEIGAPADTFGANNQIIRFKDSSLIAHAGSVTLPNFGWDHTPNAGLNIEQKCVSCAITLTNNQYFEHDFSFEFTPDMPVPANTIGYQIRIKVGSTVLPVGAMHGGESIGQGFWTVPTNYGGIINAPTNVSTVSGNQQITINWTPSTSSANSQMIFRATSAGGPYTPIKQFYNNTTATYIDTGLTNGTTYYYVIRANKTGVIKDTTLAGASIGSLNSAEVSAVPNIAGLTVSTFGSQTANFNSGISNTYLGGAFTLSINTGTASVSNIKVSNNGTAGNLSDIRLYYDTDGTYAGTESCFNTVCTDGGGGTLGTGIAGSMGTLSSGTTYYVYVVADIAGTVAGGGTIDLQITNPSTDITTTVSNTDTGIKNITGTATIRPNITSITYPITSPLNGSRIGQSITINGAGFGATCDGVNNRITIGGATNVVSCTGTTFSDTSISITNFQYSSGDSYGGTVSLLARIGGTDDDASQDMYVYPDITDITNPTAYTNAAREYSASDSDGVITINGNHFGTAQGTGSVTVLGTTVSGGDIVSWGATAIQIRIPTAISDSSYTGNIVVNQGTGGNLTASDTYGSSIYRILPRVISLNPNSGATNDLIIVIGNHLCQSGTCPLAGSRSTASDNATFFSGVQVTDGNVTAWGHGDSSTSGVSVNVPSSAATGNVAVRSNNYDSNSVSFTKLSSAPTDPTNLYQFETNTDLGEPPASYDPLTETNPAGKVAVGGGINQTNVWMRATASAGVNSTLCIEVEAKTVATAFDGTGTVLATSAPGCQAFTVGTPVKLFVNVTTGLTDGNNYKWRARIKNSGTSEYGGWVNASVDGSSKSFYIDTSAPSMSCVAPTAYTASTADISWTPTDGISTTFTKQLQYGADSSFAISTCTPGSTCGTPSSGLGANPQTIQLTGLTPNAVYYYRERSKDAAGNEAVEGYGLNGNTTCTFTTSKANMRTAEFIVTGETGAVSAETIRNFQVYLTEQGANIQNAFVELSGIAGTGGGASLTLGLKVEGSSTVSYTDYDVAISNSTATPFTILHKVDPTASGLYIAPASSNNNKLYINPSSGDSVYIASAKIVVTYYYTP